LCGNAARTYDGLGILVTSGVYMSLFNKRIEKEAIEKERIKVREVFADVEENANNLALSIDDVSERIEVVSGEATNMSSVMEEFTASLQEMSSNITELSESMEEMDESFVQMSEEAQEGKISNSISKWCCKRFH